jgi:hypothetical protein
MTATHSIPSTVLVAIDISKHRHEVLIGVPGKKRRRRMTIMNTLEDFHRLSAALVGYDLPVRIGFEATGNYHRPLAHHLGQVGFDLKLISSVGLARTREALHNSWDKNDPKDAQVILHMLEIGAVQFFHDPLCEGGLRRAARLVEVTRLLKTDATAGLSDRCSECALQIVDNAACPYRPHSFFDNTSCSIALSRDKSATISFRRLFSSSNCLRRLTSDGISPPYFLRHR